MREHERGYFLERVRVFFLGEFFLEREILRGKQKREDFFSWGDLRG